MLAWFIALGLKLVGIGQWIKAGFVWLLDHPKALLALAAALIVGLLLLQSVRLSHAKADLKGARAALVDPATHRKWQDEATERLRDLKTCRTNTDTLQTALDLQNSSLTALTEAGRKAKAEATAAVERARSAVAAADKARASISAPLKAAEVCAQVDEVDRRFMETIR